MWGSVLQDPVCILFMQECMLSSKERRRALRKSHDPNWQCGDTHNISSINSSLEEWLLARHKIGESAS
jgi:hypothetical protein